ncbi:DUF6894 family protein [Bradyrhizobium australiense]|uniref:DUF6894 domain-containing protein n=1 Tax=Bradyrhizobium australiense TaxID=2721161 RepID=A0A7Y4GWB2_9BRAD|nr:hypothetical protein [Bradyrhizobium australiense]NOJ43116.1 hypothetical protein [Bradyrhizobium australiense]
MRRYYFDLREGDDISPDEEGMEFATVEAVQQEAARSLADMARDAVMKRHNGAASDLAVDVRDENGPVLHVKFTVEIDRHRR